MTGTLAKMVALALVVLLAAALCAAVPLGSRKNEQNFSSPVLDSGRPTKEPIRIIDGEPACRDQFRHQARVIGDERLFFGGSLIKPTAILTKGNLYKFKKFTIRLGTIFREGDDSAVTVESIWALVHPDYDEEAHRKNNIGVILLNVEVPLGKSIWPVKLPSFDEVDETFTGRRALISGFGWLNASGESPTDRLHFTEVTVLSNDLCKRFYKEDKIIDSKLCAGNANGAFCPGDIGGPLVIKTGGQYKQIGIASFYFENCEEAIPGVYTRVTSYLEWIQRAAGKLDDWEADEYSYYN